LAGAAGGRRKAAAPRSGPTFGRIKTRRAFEEVCDQIRREMAAGSLVPGDRLPAERDLAQQFGVSRTAVREALRSLEVAGVIFSRKGVTGGSFIKEGDPEVITQAVRDMVLLGQISNESITEARILITNDAIRVACERATAADLDAIEQDIDRAEQLTFQGNLSRRSQYITEFYRLVAKATHNEVIVMLVDSLSEIVRHQLERISPEPRKDVIEVRRRILKHLRARDAAKATHEMTTHLKNLGRYVQEQERARRA
jgi:DNA-binding FadR family transcriptional regulator